jgi:hypothetical protein
MSSRKGIGIYTPIVVRPGGARRRGDVGRQRWLCGVGVEVAWTATTLLVSLLSRYGGEADVGRAGHTKLFTVRRQQRRLRVMAEWAAWGWRRWLEVLRGVVEARLAR